MITYELADFATIALRDHVMETWHQNLVGEGVKIGILFVRSLDKDGMPNGKFPLKKAGHPAAAQVKVVPLKDRVTKEIDAEIHIDAESWKLVDERTRTALLDHEIEHLELVYDKKTGSILQKDDLDRPKLKCKPDDFFLWGIETIARRHGMASSEVMNARRLANTIGAVLGIALSNTAPKPNETPTPAPEPTPA